MPAGLFRCQAHQFTQIIKLYPFFSTHSHTAFFKMVFKNTATGEDPTKKTCVCISCILSFIHIAIMLKMAHV